VPKHQVMNAYRLSGDEDPNIVNLTLRPLYHYVQ